MELGSRSGRSVFLAHLNFGTSFPERLLSQRESRWQLFSFARNPRQIRPGAEPTGSETGRCLRKFVFHPTLP